MLEFHIPPGWSLAKAGQVAQIKSGSTPSRQKHQEYFADGVHPWIKTMDLTNGPIYSTDEKITDLALAETSCPLLPPGTVLVAMYGGFNQIGRTGLMTFNGSINQAISALTVNPEKLTPEYLLYWFNTNMNLWRNFAASSRKDPNITRSDIEAFPVLLPPLLEQHKIAEILSTWDGAIDLTEQLIAAKQWRKQALMQRLLTGKVRFPGFVGEWEEVKLEDVAQINPSRVANVADELEISFVGMADVSEDAKLVSPTTKIYAEVKSGFTPFIDNDILVAKITPCFENGKGALVQGLKNGLGFGSTEFHVIRTNPAKADVRFLLYHTITHQFRGRGESSMTGSAGQKRVPAEFVASFKIGLPSLSEQRKIADVLVACDGEVDLLNQKLTALHRQKQGLMQQLLTGKIRVKV